MLKKSNVRSEINGMIGTALGVGFVTPDQLIYCVVCFIVFLPITITNAPKGLVLFGCAYGLWWGLTGKDPRDWIEKTRQPKKYIAGEPELDFNKAGMPIRGKMKRTSVTYKIHGKAKKFNYVEEKYKLYTYGQIELDGKEVGYYLLRRGVKLLFIFAWVIEGYDPSMSEQDAYTILSACTEGLNNFPKDIDLKFYNDLEKSCKYYKRMQAELLLSKDLDPLSEEIIRSRAERAEDLAKEGRLLNHKITVFAKYRIELGGDYAVNQNWLEELLSQTQPLVGAIKKQDFDSKQGWEKVIKFAYQHAFKKVNFLLNNNKGGFGLRVKPLSVQNIYDRDWLELHELDKTNPKPPLIPQYAVLDKFGLRNVVNEWGTHAIGSIFEDQILPVVPQFDKHLAYYPAKNKYAGFIKVGQLRTIPKDKESIPRGYLKYLWNILAGSEQAIYDSRVVTEITADRSGIEVVNLERMMTNSLKREARAMKSQNVDVIAMRRKEEAIEARDLLADGNIPYWVSLGIWLYRDSPEELEHDLIELAGQIIGASVLKVENCLEDIWFQSLPFEWEAFLTKPHHRRKKYPSFQAIPSLPLVKIEEIDKKGVMFVSRELSSPIYIDFANEKNHTAIIAKTGAGKSNVILEILIEYIINGSIAVLFDFPRPTDGSSTFTVLIPLLQELGVRAVYHNVRENTINIIEMPDLSGIGSDAERQKRLSRTRENHVRLLRTIVMGTANDPTRELVVTSLLTLCYSSFHENKEIKKRYSEALEGGYGSKAYLKMPILEDFVKYAKKWFVEYIESKEGHISTLVNDTIDIILTQLEGILKTPLGNSINGISSFDTKVDILVIGLTNVSETFDSLIYAMSGLNALYRAAFSSNSSLLGVDEGTILYKFPAFARETGIIPVHGRKWGCNFLIAAQEIATILNSCSGGEIFKNLDNIFGGHIGSAALPEMTSKEVGFDEEIIKPYTNKAFKPSAELLQSYWYLKRGDTHMEITHPGSEMLLALGATDPRENELRNEIMSMEKYKNNKIEGLKEFYRQNFKSVA